MKKLSQSILRVSENALKLSEKSQSVVKIQSNAPAANMYSLEKPFSLRVSENCLEIALGRLGILVFAWRSLDHALVVYQHAPLGLRHIHCYKNTVWFQIIALGAGQVSPP